MSPMTLKMTSNTSIEQKDGVHSTDGENVCNKKKRKMYMCSNCQELLCFSVWIKEAPTGMHTRSVSCMYYM